MKYLGVVGHKPLGGVTHNEEQTHCWVHVPHSCRDLGSCEVARGLLYSELVGKSEGHLGAVPGQASAKVLLHVEEVHLTDTQESSLHLVLKCADISINYRSSAHIQLELIYYLVMISYMQLHVDRVPIFLKSLH